MTAALKVAAGARHWIAVASRDHVERGVAGGFCQVCHGKAAPLRRMRAGDWIAYYSPRVSFEGATPLRAFTAIGRLRGDEVEQVIEMRGGAGPRPKAEPSEPRAARTRGPGAAPRAANLIAAPGFKPFRRCVEFLSCREAPMAALAPELSFSAGGRNWGLVIRRGCVEIDQADFARIADAMGVSLSP